MTVLGTSNTRIYLLSPGVLVRSVGVPGELHQPGYSTYTRLRDAATCSLVDRDLNKEILSQI